MPGPARLPDFKTRRLSVSDWAGISNAILIPALRSMLTPEVLAHLPPTFATKTSDTDLSKWITHRRQEATTYAITRPPHPSPIGLLFVHNDTANLHIGYLIAPHAQRRGYASELLHGLITAATTQAPITLIAGVDPSNTASVKLLQKSGFTRTRPDPDTGMHSYHHTIPRPSLP